MCIYVQFPLLAKTRPRSSRLFQRIGLRLPSVEVTRSKVGQWELSSKVQNRVKSLYEKVQTVFKSLKMRELDKVVTKAVEPCTSRYRFCSVFRRGSLWNAGGTRRYLSWPKKRQPYLVPAKNWSPIPAGLELQDWARVQAPDANAHTADSRNRGQSNPWSRRVCPWPRLFRDNKNRRFFLRKPADVCTPAGYSRKSAPDTQNTLPRIALVELKKDRWPNRPPDTNRFSLDQARTAG